MRSRHRIHKLPRCARSRYRRALLQTTRASVFGCLLLLSCTTAAQDDRPPPLVPSTRSGEIPEAATVEDAPAETVTRKQSSEIEALRERLLREPEKIGPQEVRAAAALNPAALEAVAPLLFSEVPQIAYKAREVCEALVLAAGPSKAVAQALASCIAAPQPKALSRPLGVSPLELLTAIGQLQGGDISWTRGAGEWARAELAYLLRISGGDDVARELPEALVPPSERARVALDAGRADVAESLPEAMQEDLAVLTLPDRADGIEPAKRHSKPLRRSLALLLARDGVTPAKSLGNISAVPEEERQTWVDAGLYAAAAFTAAGKHEQAAGLLLELWEHVVRRYQTRSILAGLAALESPEAPQLALGYVNNEKLRDTAIHVLATAPDSEWDSRLIQLYEKSNPVTRATLLEAIVRRNTPKAAPLLEEARRAGSPLLRYTADRLANQPSHEADLLDVALAGPPWSRDEALRLFLDEAHSNAIEGDLELAGAQFRTIVEGPFPVEAQQEALEGLGNLGLSQYVPLVEAASADPDLYTAAYYAMTRLVAAQQHASREEELLSLLKDAPDERSSLAALEGLAVGGDDITPLLVQSGYLLHWEILGPFPDPAGDGLMKIYFNESEASGKEEVSFAGVTFSWRPAEARGVPPAVDLSAALGAYEQSLAYGAARIVARQWQPVSFQVRTHGAFAFWVNGKRLFSGEESQLDDVETVEVPGVLQPGVNRLLIKVLQHDGEWRYGVRVTDRRGAALDLSDQRLPDDGAAGVGVRPGSFLESVEEELP